MFCKSAHSPYEVLRDVRKVVRPRHIRVGKKVLLRVIRIITVSEKELEQMEQAQEIKLLVGALHRYEQIQIDKRDSETNRHKRKGCFATHPVEVVRH